MTLPQHPREEEPPVPIQGLSPISMGLGLYALAQIRALCDPMANRPKARPRSSREATCHVLSAFQFFHSDSKARSLRDDRGIKHVRKTKRSWPGPAMRIKPHRPKLCDFVTLALTGGFHARSAKTRLGQCRPVTYCRAGVGVVRASGQKHTRHLLAMTTSGGLQDVCHHHVRKHWPVGRPTQSFGCQIRQ